jgi:prevent-host-death family protein
MARKNGTWPVAKAKAKFSALIDRALEEGPQTITRNGRKAVVVASLGDWERKKKRRGTLVEFFQNSPLRDTRIEIKRKKGGVREIVL